MSDESAAWEKWAAESAKNASLKALAKKLCLVNGYEPDSLCLGYQNGAHARGAKGTVALLGPIRPQWTLYVVDAEVAMDVLEST